MQLPAQTWKKRELRDTLGTKTIDTATFGFGSISCIWVPVILNLNQPILFFQKSVFFGVKSDLSIS